MRNYISENHLVLLHLKRQMKKNRMQESPAAVQVAPKTPNP